MLQQCNFPPRREWLQSDYSWWAAVSWLQKLPYHSPLTPPVPYRPHSLFILNSRPMLFKERLTKWGNKIWFSFYNFKRSLCINTAFMWPKSNLFSMQFGAFQFPTWICAVQEENLLLICAQSQWFVHMQHKSWSLTSTVNILESLHFSILWFLFICIHCIHSFVQENLLYTSVCGLDPDRYFSCTIGLVFRNWIGYIRYKIYTENT